MKLFIHHLSLWVKSFFQLLGYQDPPEWDTDYVAAIAANCNMQKYNAKRAGEASSELYLAHFVQNQKPYIQDCAVVDVKERSFDAIVLQTGSIIRIYQNVSKTLFLYLNSSSVRT